MKGYVMEQRTGVSILNSIVIGKIHVLQKKKTENNFAEIIDIDGEIARFEYAKVTAQIQLKELYEKTRQQLNGNIASIFEMQSMLLEDENFLASIYKYIRIENRNVEYAILKTKEDLIALFSQMEDEYMRARGEDIIDISEHLIKVLNGNKIINQELTKPIILVAEGLTSSEIISLDKTNICGIVTKHGTRHSHFAILARALKIPVLIGIDIQEHWQGKMAVVDGFSATVTIEPDEEYMAMISEKIQETVDREVELSANIGQESVTKSGKKIHLYANIGSIDETVSALENDTEGIGLFRTEFLYLESKEFPSEEEQFKIYKTVVEKMERKKVIIRTLDIGADKQVDYFKLEKEENPALGYRGIRICLDREDIFRTQLRSIYRASAFGNIAIMFPMIISMEEVKKIKTILEEVKQKLKEQKIKFQNIEIGIMIETPAAVMISDDLAGEVDFFSIGTNDLTQYMLAIDRQNPSLEKLNNPHHPAILQAIHMVIKNGHKHGIWVGICGELAADLSLTEELIQMGIDELSVSPINLLPLREKIRNIK